MTDDRTEMQAAREAGLRQRHEQRLARAREGIEFPADGVERTAYLEGDPVTAPEEAVRDAEKAWRRAYHAKPFTGDDHSWMRAALQAALPHLHPTACTCPTDADVTPDMRSETGQHLSGCPFAAEGLGAWMDEQIERINETKALVETATRLGRALGRKEVGEEMAAAFEAFFPDPHTETEACEDCMVVHEFAAIARNIAAREIATKEPK